MIGVLTVLGMISGTPKRKYLNAGSTFGFRALAPESFESLKPKTPKPYKMKARSPTIPKP